MSKTRVFNFVIEKPLYDWLTAQSQREGLSRAGYIKKVLRFHQSGLVQRLIGDWGGKRKNED